MIGDGRRGVSEEASKIVAGYNLDQNASIDMPNLNKGRFKGEYIRIM